MTLAVTVGKNAKFCVDTAGPATTEVLGIQNISVDADWETKKISEELQKSNHEQTALIRAYLREAAQLYVEGEPWKSRITDRRLCRNTILNHLQMLANVSFWLREQGEPLAEEVCGWLLAQETADVQKVRSGQSLEVAREIYPAVQRKRA